MMPTGRGHARPALSPPPSAPAHRAAAHTEPVSILIGRTQVALARERSAKRLRETFESNLEAFERLRIIVNDMLSLLAAIAASARPISPTCRSTTRNCAPSSRATHARASIRRCSAAR